MITIKILTSLFFFFSPGSFLTEREFKLREGQHHSAAQHPRGAQCQKMNSLGPLLTEVDTEAFGRPARARKM